MNELASSFHFAYNVLQLFEIVHLIRLVPVSFQFTNSQAVALVVSRPGYYLTELAAATVAAACASVRRWRAATVAADW
ncbi:hypothetical protein Tco_1311590 [Tanacetum coccineum]